MFELDNFRIKIFFYNDILEIKDNKYCLWKYVSHVLGVSKIQKFIIKFLHK
jgi:hypothetical protein